jgi:hypothetical protein
MPATATSASRPVRTTVRAYVDFAETKLDSAPARAALPMHRRSFHPKQRRSATGRRLASGSTWRRPAAAASHWSRRRRASLWLARVSYDASFACSAVDSH